MPPLKKKFKDIKSASIILQAFNIYEGYTCENQIMLTRKRYISARGINPGFCPCNVALLTASAKSSVYTLYI